MRTPKKTLIWGGSATTVPVIAAIFTVTWITLDSQQDLSFS